MGKNAEGYRVGAVSGRSQCYNPKTDKYVKRDNTTGRFMATSDNKFKGVRKEESAKQAAKSQKK